MSTQAVLQVAPDELRRGCALLRGAAIELESLGTRVRAGCAVSEGWSGLAALEQRARVHAMEALIVSTTGPPEVVAAAVEQCADEASTAAQQVRSWGRVKEQALAQSRALRAAGPPPEPVLEQVWRHRLQELDQEESLATRRSQEAGDQFAESQQRAARTIEGAWSTVREVVDVATLASKAWKTLGLTTGIVGRLVLATDAALAAARSRWAQGEKVRARAAGRARARVGQLRTISTPGYAPKQVKALKLTPGPLGLVTSLVSAASDVRTGGGYDGWRGRLTRGLAGGALAGLPLVGVGFFFPPAGLVGVGLIGAYSAWSAGNAVWDGRGTVIRYARQFARGVGVLRDQAVRVGKNASVRMQQVRSLAMYATGKVVLAADRGLRRSWAAVDEMLGRLPEVEPARQWWRDLGDPIRLPAVPLGPVLRIPVDLGRLWP